MKVFMVKVSYEQKPFRKAIMQTFDANVTPSPSNTTEACLLYTSDAADE